MTVARENHRAMEQLLLQQIAVAGQMETALKEENDALRKRDATSVSGLAQRKTQLTEALTALGVQQQQLLVNMGLSLSRPGIDEFINGAPQAEQHRLKDIFKRLQHQLEQCQRQNLINGNIISANRQAAEMALAILRGQIHREPSLYNANGQAPSGNQGNTLAKA